MLMLFARPGVASDDDYAIPGAGDPLQDHCNGLLSCSTAACSTRPRPGRCATALPERVATDHQNHLEYEFLHGV
jgi:hypothetical protein